MKVTTDACLFGAWATNEMQGLNLAHILDMGTGTGLLALMVAQKTHASIDAVEIDPAAAEEAEENIKKSPWLDRIRLMQQDIRTFVPGKLYDVIICNPPFYENELASENVKKNLAHHNTEWSLREVFDNIYRLLNAKGTFFLLLTENFICRKTQF